MFKRQSRVSFRPGEPAKVELPEKNTFIHFDSHDEDEDIPLRTEATCPGIMQKAPFRTNSSLIREQMMKVELHARGDCRPCAYFAFKKDGCRMGDDCEYCHLCDRSDIRRWKRVRAKALKLLGIDAPPSAGGVEAV